MGHNLAIAVHSKTEHCQEAERDVMRVKSQLHIVLGATRLAAQAHNDFRLALVKELEERGGICREFFEGATHMLDEELERLEAAESLLDEDIQAVLP